VQFRKRGKVSCCRNSLGSGTISTKRKSEAKRVNRGKTCRLHAEMKVSRNSQERRSGERIIAGTVFRLKFQACSYVFVFLFLFNSHFLLCRKQNILQKNECAASENTSNTVSPVATGWGAFGGSARPNFLVTMLSYRIDDGMTHW